MDKPTYEFVKMMCQPVMIIRDGDKILTEDAGPAYPCYSQEQLQEHWDKAQDEVAQMNAAAAEAAKTQRKTPRKRSRRTS